MININRILCPTDLSREADAALRYAVALARVYKAKLSLIYCTESAEDDYSIEDVSRRHIKSLFEESLAEYLGLADFSTLDWEGIVVECNDVSEAIIREAAARRADLIVMRSRRRPHAAILLGSTAETVCQSAPCPVLVTHPQEREWVGLSTGEIDLKRILVPYDFSEYSERGLQYALSLAQEYQAELHLLHVMPKPSDEPGTACVAEDEEGASHQAARRLQKSVPTEAQLWCNVKYIVRRGKPHQEILTYAGENQIDLISIGAGGQFTISQAFLGSNVERVLREAPCPMLVARALAEID